MNGLASDEPRWKVRTWIYVVMAILAGQAGLLCYVGQRELTVPPRPGFSTTVHFVADAWWAEQLNALPGATDPTLLALPAPQSFSGAAWMRGTPLAYRPAPWIEPPRWLAPDSQGLGAGFAQLVATYVLTPPTIADKPAPLVLRYEPTFPSDPLPPRSTLQVEGAIESRPLLQPLDLQSWASQELLSNSVVQVLVDADGFTLSTEPLGSCGLAEADRQALRLANAARFQPLPRKARDATGSGPLAWGKLIFHWHTRPFAATNPPVALP